MNKFLRSCRLSKSCALPCVQLCFNSVFNCVFDSVFDCMTVPVFTFPDNRLLGLVREHQCVVVLVRKSCAVEFSLSNSSGPVIELPWALKSSWKA